MMWSFIKKINFLISVVFLSYLLSFAVSNSIQTDSSQSKEVSVPTLLEPPTKSSQSSPKSVQNSIQINLPLEEITLTKKIGQMLLVGFRGFRVDENTPIIADIQRFNVGGVILFDYDLLKKARRNIKSPRQLKKLIEQLQFFSSNSLFVAIDQEGGIIQRLKPKFGFPPSVSAQYLGKINNPQLTYKKAFKMAQTLAKLGINWNFAPVVDLNINPKNPVIGRFERSFSANPQIVVQQAIEFIKAHHAQGILTALKHFPGHGSSISDSHKKWADVTKTWKNSELEPYREIIKVGLADAIMVAHIYNKNLDPSFPATLSKEIIVNKLRQDLNFNGLVVSDDMQMKAIVGHYGYKKAIQFAIEAGNDILVIGNNLEYDENIVPHTVSIINQLVKEGNITQKRIDESYNRIQNLKRKSFKRTLSLHPVPITLVEKAPEKKYKLMVNTIPSDSQIRIKNIRSTYKPNIELPKGLYHIEISRPGYKTLELWIRISDKNITLPVILEKKSCPSKKYSLIVNAKPSQSKIKIIGIRANYEPGMCIPPGKYKISVIQRGYFKYQDNIKVDSDRFIDVHLEPKTQNK